MCFKDFLVLFFLIEVAASSNEGFIFNGFSSGMVSGQNKSLDLAGVAEANSDGLCRLTNSEPFKIGHAFYSDSFRFKNSSNASASSFSTTFVFAMVPENSQGQGMAFVLAPSKEFISGQWVSYAEYLGLFYHTNNGNQSNHIVAIELGTFENLDFGDPIDNHVGIDINGLESKDSNFARFVTESGQLDEVDLAIGEGRQLWVEYDGSKHQLNVTLSPSNETKPKPLLSKDIDLSPYILDQMYVGFSSSNGVQTASNYVLGCSFQMDGKAEDLDRAKLSSIPGARVKKSRKQEIALAVGLSLAGVFLVAVISSAIFILARKKGPFTEILEDWEVQFGPHRFAYKDLVIATRGFNEKELLGQGGFGQIFKGELLGSKDQIAVKRIFHRYRQGMKEFIAEIGTIGRLRHPNLV
ncbi:hypothetical protein DITRI_Ditri06bG0077400 [Diplodiscus trichospermus]